MALGSASLVYRIGCSSSILVGAHHLVIEYHRRYWLPHMSCINISSFVTTHSQTIISRHAPSHHHITQGYGYTDDYGYEHGLHSSSKSGKSGSSKGGKSESHGYAGYSMDYVETIVEEYGDDYGYGSGHGSSSKGGKSGSSKSGKGSSGDSSKSGKSGSSKSGKGSKGGYHIMGKGSKSGGGGGYGSGYGYKYDDGYAADDNYVGADDVIAQLSTQTIAQSRHFAQSTTQRDG
eukprot:scaffold1822_cov221-Alexandrium_tamarense.AAC.7